MTQPAVTIRSMLPGKMPVPSYVVPSVPAIRASPGAVEVTLTIASKFPSAFCGADAGGAARQITNKTIPMTQNLPMNPFPTCWDKPYSSTLFWPNWAAPAPHFVTVPVFDSDFVPFVAKPCRQADIIVP